MFGRDIDWRVLEGIRGFKAYEAGEINLGTRELKELSFPREIQMP